VTEILLVCCVIASLAYTALKVKNQVHMLQLNSYRNERYWRWASKNPARLFGPRELLPLAGLPLIAAGYQTAGMLVWLAGNGLLMWTAAKPVEKKKLVYTFRVKRLLTVITLLLAAVGIAGALIRSGPLGVLTALALANLWPFGLVLLGNTLAGPVEKAIQGHYYRQAKDKLRQMPALTVIGVTGSYGKTSTKHVLAKILSAKYNVLMTPES
jgi:UDP-N-acetylmuramoyl-tripeptide--D-alanyl-D-alanine ligase